MRAYLIDPGKRTVEEIDFDGGYKALCRTLGCHSFTTGAVLDGSLTEGCDILSVRGDNIEECEDTEHWFQVDADRDPPSSYPICGRGLVVWCDTEGADCGARIGLDELKTRIRFTNRKFRGYTVEQIPGCIVIDVVAPVVETE